MKISTIQKQILYVLLEAEEEDIICLVNPVFNTMNMEQIFFFDAFNKAIMDLYKNEIIHLSNEYYYPNKEKAYVKKHDALDYFPLEKLLVYKDDIGWVRNSHLSEDKNLVFILSDKGKEIAQTISF